ncbi:NYN domain-containing protein [Sulfuricystis multivorans]|uniref:NYN domain-containing protein n=1 Tax=Sulfuricystis multivorans TaxID=2211108 RepID=UPI000F83B973|nr:NYN domain-containing protein [Sulfuricystis multivorans]
MALSADDVSMALFCDFENIALGVRDAQYEKFDIKPVLERLLLKGSIVVKKAYCDWERYKSFKAAMHEANFELIEIPHVRQSGKNSADIRMVVDALDLCYTKSHVNTFVIISGDSDFSPLVSKLRENAKRVIGVGVKQSTSDLLIANCDEFIYIDDLMRKRSREDKQAKKPADPQEMEARRTKGLEMAAATLEALLEDRSDDEKVWASVLKEAIKRRHPGFNEAYHGFKTFGALLEEAARRGLMEVGREANSTYVKRRLAQTSAEATPAEMAAPEPATTLPSPSAAEGAVPPAPTLRGEAAPGGTSPIPPAPTLRGEAAPGGTSPIPPVPTLESPSAEAAAPAPAPRRRGRGRKPAAAAEAPAAAESAPVKPAEPAKAASAASVESAPAAPVEAKTEAQRKLVRKPRSPRRRKDQAPVAS